jgi:hypothetical protein
MENLGRSKLRPFILLTPAADPLTTHPGNTGPFVFAGNRSTVPVEGGREET